MILEYSEIFLKSYLESQIAPSDGCVTKSDLA